VNRPAGFYWTSLDGNEPLVAFFDGDEWTFTGDATPYTSAELPRLLVLGEMLAPPSVSDIVKDELRKIRRGA